MSTLLRYSLVAAWMLGLAGAARGQVARADSTLPAVAYQALQARYAELAGFEQRLYNGPEYVPYLQPGTKGHPYFGAVAARPGAICYEGHRYADVPLRYDLVRDQLVLPAPDGQLHLLGERVAQFELDGHTFVRLEADEPNGLGSTGFYDVLLDGPVRLLARRRKDLQEYTTFNGFSGEVTASEQFWAEKNHRYYALSRLADVLALFPQQKPALRRYAAEQALDFGPEARERSLQQLLSYAGTLPVTGG